MNRDLSKLAGMRCERVAHLDTRTINIARREVSASLSSEIEVPRPFGSEILVHSADSIDLTRAKDGLPLLWNHNTDQPIGLVDNVKLVGNVLRGVLRFSDNPQAEIIWNDVRQGFLKNISIGYQINQWEEQTNSDQIRVTGWSLLESSVVAIPADATVGINRAFQGVPTMTENATPVVPDSSESPPAPVDFPGIKNTIREAKKAGSLEARIGERKRIAEIDELFSLSHIPRTEYYHGLREYAIHAEYSIDAARKLVLEAMAGECEPAMDYRMPDGLNGGYAPIATHEGRLPPAMPAPPSNQSRGLGRTTTTEDALDKFTATATQALLVRCAVLNSPEEVQKSRSGGMERMSLTRMAEQYLRAINVQTSGLGDEDMAGRAFTAHRASGMTTSDFTNILANVANKALLQGWEEANETWPLWTRRGQVSDFKVTDRAGLSGFSGLDTITEDGEIKYGKFTDRKEQIQLVEYAKKFRLSRRTIINDDLNAFSGIPRMMGRAANRKVGDVVYSKLDGVGPTLNQDSTVLFDASTHKNYSATTGAPTTTTLAVVYKAMALQLDPNSSAVLNIVPSYMIVPKTLEPDALALQNNVYDPAGTAGTLKSNPYVNRFKVISDGRMDGLTNGTTAWVMAADPNVYDTIEVAFLNGISEPYLREQQEWDSRGCEYCVGIDFGVSVLDFRGLFRYKGA